MPKPTTGRTSGWTLRARRLNWREILPIRSLRHPANLTSAPSDAVAVLWLESDGAGADPQFAYLNYARAVHLYHELGRVLHGEGDSSVERARRMLHATEGVRHGEVSGA